VCLLDRSQQRLRSRCRKKRHIRARSCCGLGSEKYGAILIVYGYGLWHCGIERICRVRQRRRFISRAEVVCTVNIGINGEERTWSQGRRGEHGRIVRLLWGRAMCIFRGQDHAGVAWMGRRRHEHHEKEGLIAGLGQVACQRLKGSVLDVGRGV